MKPSSYLIQVVRGLFLLSMVVVLVACQDGDDSDMTSDEMAGDSTPDPAMTEVEGDEEENNEMMGSATEDDGGMDDDMMALGGTAETEVIAEHTIETGVGGSLAWVGYELGSSGESSSTIHSEAPGFVYAVEGTHTIVIDDEEMVLEPEEAVFAAAEVEYRHTGDGRVWDIRLTEPAADPPEGIEADTPVFASESLEGLPDESADVRFIRVELPAGSETSIHTHPGPEYIYVTQGEIMYQNELIDPEPMQAGDDHALPRDTAVQKRNPDGDTAVFLSWFVVDSDMPFAPESSFD